MTEMEPEMPPELSEMPRHVKESIVESLGTADKLSLRQVDFQFKEIVGNAGIHYEKLKMTLRPNRVNLCWRVTREKVVEQEFVPKGNGYEIIRESPYPVKYEEGDYRKAAVAKMLSIFKNPKVSVGKLVMVIDNSEGTHITYNKNQEFKADTKVIFEEIGRILSLKNFRLNVGKLKTRFPISKEMFMRVLPYLEPGILKSLQLLIGWFPLSGLPTHSSGFDDRLITDTEQWRQMKQVEIDVFRMNVPLEKYLHFANISLHFFRRPNETMKTILERMLQTSTMKQCDLVHCSLDGFDMTGAQEYVNQFEKVPASGYGYITRIKNPYEAEKLVEISMRAVSLYIEKLSVFDFD